MKENKKWIYKYVNNKRRAKENLRLLLDMKGNIITKGKENVFFASVFNRKN